MKPLNQNKMEQRETECCTPNGQIKRYKDCIGCNKKPLELNQNNMTPIEKAKELVEKYANTNGFYQEELMDAILYLTKIKNQLKNK